jgi:translation initiation factor 1
VAELPVYSTDPSFCAACRRSPCTCGDKTQISKRQPEPLRLSFTRSSKGSGVTKVERLVLHPTLKEQLLSKFKKRLGCGGAIKDGAIEIQGDHRDFIEAELIAEGYKVKRIGG